MDINMIAMIIFLIKLLRFCLLSANICMPLLYSKPWA